MSDPIRGNSLLSRASASPSGLTPLQSQVDGLVGGFARQATDWRSLAAMTAGGMTYRLGRMGAMAAGTGRLASVGIGLGAEVTAFEMTNRSLSSLTGETHSNPNLWRWDGQGGIRQGLLSSLVTFGTLKGAGRLAQGENVVVQHLLQDTGMVLGHQVSASFGITDRPQGTLAEQFLHAEATNLQMGAGMTLAHSVAPGIQGLERGLDLSIRSNDVGARFPRPQFMPHWMGEETSPLLAIVGRGSSEPRRGENIAGPLILLSQRWDDAKAIPPSIEEEITSVRSRPNLPPQPPVFQDPVEALREADFPEDYEPGRTYRIAKEGENELSAVSRGIIMMWNGENHAIDYFLNGSRIGHRIIQLRPHEKTLVGLDLRIEPPYQGRDLSKMIAWHNLSFAHQKGWSYVMDMIVNRRILASAAKSFHAGEMMFAPGATVRMRGPTLDPFEPEMVDLSSPVPLESFDAGTAVFDNFRAYRVTGRPNPQLFERLKSPVVPLAFGVPQVALGRRIPRSIPSSDGGEHPFDLIMGSWDQLALEINRREVAIAIRKESVIKVSLYDIPYGPSKGSFVLGEMREWLLSLKEGWSKGSATLFVEPNAFGLYAIDTVHSEVNRGPAMDTGAGTIFMEWLATEASLHGVGFNVLQIENPHVFRILRRSALMDPATTIVEACTHRNPLAREYKVNAVFPFADFDPSQGSRPHFWNVRGRPNPNLVPRR
jgi:hypothetical protein